MKRTPFIFIILISLLYISCKYELVSSPTSNGYSSIPADYNNLLPPQNLEASHGNYRVINLHWEGTKNAKQYQIFSAQTPFDTFVQIGETKGNETDYTVEEYTGTSKYYLIKTVDSKGNVSSGSRIVNGTTIDVPIITEITNNEDGSSVEVEWWMENCTEETYARDINFTVTVYDSSKTKLAGKEVTTDGFTTHASITGLLSNTKYYFVVEAVKTESDQKAEKSDFTDVETAHRLVPDAPQNLTATQGDYKNKVVLSWNLPSKTDYCDKKTMIYTNHSLFFKIYRKLASEDDSAFTCIASKEKPVVYEEGALFTWEDTSAERGKQYTYKVQSFTDVENTAGITSEKNSQAVIGGWSLSPLSFSITPEYIKEDTTITQINVSPNLNFQNHGKSYTYVVTHQRTPLPSQAQTPEAEAVIGSYNSIGSLNNAIYTFYEISNDIKGTYIYHVYVTKETDGIVTEKPSEYIDFYLASNIITVTDVAEEIPEITKLQIKDGYKDKYILTWNYIEGATYSLNWYSNLSDELQKQTLTASEYTRTGNDVVYHHPAVSGEIRRYTLIATKNHIPSTKEYEANDENNPENFCYTLGTPEPKMTRPEYRKIVVKWPSVQCAKEDYNITAKYTGGSSVIKADKSNLKITTEDQMIICTITEPEGYDQISKSGLPVDFTVRANSNKTEDYTDSQLIVRTLGPALTQTTVEKTNIQDTRISMSFNKVEGASGYIIYRTKYCYNKEWTDWTFEKADTYFYDASNDTETAKGKLKANKTDVSSSRAKIELANGRYTLIDYSCNQTDFTSTYEQNQAQIIWGIPFGYVVVPVNGNEDDFTFGMDDDYLKVTGGNSEVIYTSAFSDADTKTATSGYGLHVDAAKAENAATQIITWAPPYFASKKTPTLYRRLSGSTGQWQRVDSSISASGTLVTAQYAPIGEDKNAANKNFRFTQSEYLPYEYAVFYSSATGASVTNFAESYITNLASTMEDDASYNYTDVNSETLNKGYLLNIPVTAAFGGTAINKVAVKDDYYYSEKVEIEPWDYETRSLGPDSYEISVFNSDSTKGWIKAATLKKDLSEDFTETVTDTTIQVDGTILRLWPTSLKNRTDNLGTSAGPLKIIRDGKHYYKITLNRTDKQISCNLGEDYSVFGYRPLSNEELCKSAMYIFAYAFYKNDSKADDELTEEKLAKLYKYGDQGTVTGVYGSAQFKSRSRATFELGVGKYKQSYIFNTYAPLLLTPSEKKVTSVLKISCDEKSAGIKGDTDNYIYTFRDEHDFTITNGDPLIPLDYSKKIKFSCSDAKNISFWEYDSAGKEKLIKSLTTAADRRSWFPMQMVTTGGADESMCYHFRPSTTDSTDYGWWEE